MPAPEAAALRGRTILVTRARAQAGELSQRLTALGARVVEFPVIRIEDPESWGDLDAALAQLDTYDWVIFTSANGVRQVARRLGETGVDPSALRTRRVAAIGPATAAALSSLEVRAALVPDEYRAEGVATAFDDVPLMGARILLPRAAVARDILPVMLRRRGATVDVVTVYRTVAGGADPEPVRAALGAGEVDAVTFASSSTVHSFLEALGADALPLLEKTAVAVIGPITAQTAREAGLTVDVEAEEYTMDGLVRGLLAALGAPGAARPHATARRT